MLIASNNYWRCGWKGKGIPRTFWHLHGVGNCRPPSRRYLEEYRGVLQCELEVIVHLYNDPRSRETKSHYPSSRNSQRRAMPFGTNTSTFSEAQKLQRCNGASFYALDPYVLARRRAYPPCPQPTHFAPFSLSASNFRRPCSSKPHHSRWNFSCSFRFASLASRSCLRASLVANHSSRARSCSSTVACATMHAFMANRCCRHVQVAVKVRWRAQDANSACG